LRSTTTNILIADTVGCLVLITIDGLTFSVYQSLVGESTIVARGKFDNLELDGSKVTLNGEGVTLG
jgi:hypothetical protein